MAHLNNLCIIPPPSTHTLFPHSDEEAKSPPISEEVLSESSTTYSRSRDNSLASEKSEATKKKNSISYKTEAFDPAKVPVIPNDLKDWLMRPASPGYSQGTVTLYIERVRSLTGTKYVLILQGDGWERQLCFASKITARKTYFAFSLDKDDLHGLSMYRSDGYLGKLRSTGEGYTLFNNGMRGEAGGDEDDDGDKRGSEDSKDSGGSLRIPMEDSRYKPRLSLAAIMTTPSGPNGSNLFQAAVTGTTLVQNAMEMDRNNFSFHWNPMEHTDTSLHDVFKSILFKGSQNVKLNDQILCLSDELNEWEPPDIVEKHSILSSVKNFQLAKAVPTDQYLRKKYTPKGDKEDSAPPEGDDVHNAEVYIEMYKISKHRHILRFAFPISPYQAFGLGIAAFLQ
jgi:hypothetical protein